MSAKAEARLTRAQAEGRSYALPDNAESRAFQQKFRSLRHEPGALLEALHLAQEAFGYLPKPVLGWIAQELKIPRNQVYTTATFYHMLSVKPEAKYVIRVCDCLSCYLEGGEAVLNAVSKAAQIPPGETSSNDGLFSLHTTSCIGLCEQAPAMMINQERYGLLNPEKVDWIISSLRRKEGTIEGGG